MGHHSNPSSKYKNRKNHAKKNIELEYSRIKDKKAQEKREKKFERANNKKKVMPNFPEEYNIVNTTSADCLYLRIPVKWSLFGKLKDRSQILFNNVLTKNFELIGGFRTIEKVFEADFDLNNVKRKDMLLNYGKKKFCKDDVSPIYYTNNNLKAFTYKHNKTWYIYFPLQIQELVKTNLIWYDAKTNYVELKTHVYEKYSIKKYKIKGHEKRCHLDLAIVHNIEDIKRCPFTYSLDNIYPKVIKSENDNRDVNCIYRIYTSEEHDLADPEMTGFKNNHEFRNSGDYVKAVENQLIIKQLYVYAVPNVVRYKRPFNRDKLPKAFHK